MERQRREIRSLEYLLTALTSATGTFIFLPQLNPYDQWIQPIFKWGAPGADPATDPAVVAAGFQIPYTSFLNDFGSSASLLQALIPFPQYAGIQNNFDSAGSALFTAMELQGEKRFSNGFSFLASLTLARNHRT